MRASAVFFGIVLAHLAVLYVSAAWRTEMYAKAAAGRPVSAEGVTVTLVSLPQSLPTPVVEPKLVKQPVRRTPTVQRAEQHAAPVVTTQGPSDNVVAAASLDPVAVPRTEEKIDATAPAGGAPPSAAPLKAPIDPSLNLPGETAVHDARTLGCNIPEPLYPARARRLKYQGEVVIAMVIGTSGEIVSATLLRSSGHAELDEAAHEAALAARCKPFLENGLGVQSLANQPFTFRLEP